MLYLRLDTNGGVVSATTEESTYGPFNDYVELVHMYEEDLSYDVEGQSNLTPLLFVYSPEQLHEVVDAHTRLNRGEKAAVYVVQSLQYRGYWQIALGERLDILTEFDPIESLESEGYQIRST